MCDSFVIRPPYTMDGYTLIGKTSDIQVNIGFELKHLLRKSHVPGEILRTTHITIPQVPTTYEYIRCKYSSVWGCEMGINEYGLAIGDEAQYTKEMRNEKLDGIISMDLVRLALERARDCHEAIELITFHLEKYGQGGNVSFAGNSHYDFSCLMADPHEAWLLETAGRKWVAKKIVNFETLSNCLKISNDWDLSSFNENAEKFEWNKLFQTKEILPYAEPRQKITYTSIASRKEKFTVKMGFDILRFHGEGFNPEYPPQYLDHICLHGYPMPGTGNILHSGSAWVAQLHPENGCIAWCTATSSPCISVFKPVFLGVRNLPARLDFIPGYIYDENSIWWRHEVLHRKVLADFKNLMPEIRNEFDVIEQEFLHDAPNLLPASYKQKEEYMEYCFNKSTQAEGDWIKRLSKHNFYFRNPSYGAMWRRLNNEAGLIE